MKSEEKILLERGGIRFVENNDTFSASNEFLSFAFSKENGMMHGAEVLLRYGGSLPPEKSAFPHFYEDAAENPSEWSASAAHSRAFEIIRLPDGAELHSSFGDARWLVTQILTFRAHDCVVRIDWSVTYRGEGSETLRSFTFRPPAWTGGRIQLPGSACVPDALIPSMPEINYVKFGAFRENGAVTDGLWSFDPFFLDLTKGERRGDSLAISFEHHVEGTLASGETIRFGTDSVMRFPGGTDAALACFRKHYSAAQTPDRQTVCSFAHDCAIYEAGAGAILFEPDFSYCPYPALSDLIADLPRIRSLGFNTLQLMPAMPFPWYTVHHYEDLAENYGAADEAQLKKLVSDAHSLGMRVLFDIVVHGVCDKESSRKGLFRYAVRRRLFRAGEERAEEVNRYRTEHPDWFRRNEDGTISFIHTWSLDFASPDLREFFFRHLERCVRDFHCDGFRIDAPYWGCQANWSDSYGGFPGASFSSNPRMFREAKERLGAKYPDLLWYTEHEHAEWRAFMDMTYTYEEGFLYRAENPDDPRPPVFAKSFTAHDMMRWYDLRDRVIPKDGVALQHTIDSHDMWWNEAKSAFARDKIGHGPARVLSALCMLLPGAFLAFAGAEAGEEPFFRELLALRERLHGTRCDYLSALPDNPFILAFLRVREGKKFLALFNLSGADAVFRVPADAGLWMNPATGEHFRSDGVLPVSLKQDGFAVLESVE